MFYFTRFLCSIKDMTEHYNQPEKRVVYATRTSDTLGAIAHKAFALPLSPTTQQRWDQLMMLMREADDIAGNITPDAATLRMHAEQSGAYDRYPLLHPDNFSASTAAELEHTIVQLFMLDRQLATATDIAHYVAAREHEARLTAHLFALTADYDTAQQPQFTEFMQALSQLAVAAGSLDTAIDARRDFTQEISQ